MDRTRTRCVVGVLALTLLAILLCDAEPALAQAKKSDSVVKVEAKADDKPDADGKQSITITITIDKDWHIYANPVENEDLDNAKTVISITSKAKLEDVKVAYPPGKPHGDKDQKYRIYDGKVTIKAQVKRARGDNGPLQVAVAVQACTDKTCILPATITKEVP